MPQSQYAVDDSIARDLSAIIPTYERPELLLKAIGSLLAGDAIPGHILISEGSRDLSARRQTELVSRQVSNSAVNVELLPPPINGAMCGNRNHLVRSVCTPYLIMLDDDCLVHPMFVASSLRLLRAGGVDLVTTYSEQAWYTFRGHWRRRQPGDALAVSLQCSTGRTRVFQEHLLDEAIEYGSEELDFTLAVSGANIIFSEFRATEVSKETVRYTTTEKRKLQEASRALVGARRYWHCRSRLGALLLLELTACASRRRPLPNGQEWRIWRSALLRIIGAPE